MKPVSHCKGCGKRKLLNHLELCKRCNRESDKHVTQEDLDRLIRERDFVREAKLKQKKAAADKEAADKEAADKEKEETEGENGAEEGKAADKKAEKKDDKKDDKKK